jgi:peptidoglycan/LPS O-acetylase OafA/YrhL
MLQGISPYSLHTLVDGSWSIVCELYFYITFPYLIYKYTKNTTDSLLAFLISTILSIAFAMLIGKNIGQDVYYGYYAFPRQIPLFLLGIYCYRLNQSLVVSLSMRHQVLIAMTVLVLYFGSSDLKVSPLGGHIYIGILFAFVMIFVSLDASNFFMNTLRVLGRQSYALFFLHLLFLKEFYKYLFSSHDFNFYTMLMVNIVVSVGLSWLCSWLFFDRIDRFFVRSVRYRRVV